MLQRRSRLITFRVTEQEYEDLRLASAARGARSVSEFVRVGVTWIIANCERRIGDVLFEPVGPLAWRPGRAGALLAPQNEPAAENRRRAQAVERQDQIATEVD